MSELSLIFLVLAAFAGGFVSGFSSFAMGLVVSGRWLHIITRVQTATLIAGYGLFTQGYGILKLRQPLDWKKLCYARHDNRHSGRSDRPELPQPAPIFVLASARCCVLCDLQPRAAGIQTDEYWRGKPTLASAS